MNFSANKFDQEAENELYDEKSSEHDSNTQEMMGETTCDEPSLKKIRTTNFLSAMHEKLTMEDQEGTIDFSEINIHNQNWFKTLLNVDIKDMRSENQEEYTVCNVQTSKGTIG